MPQVEMSSTPLTSTIIPCGADGRFGLDADGIEQVEQIAWDHRGDRLTFIVHGCVLGQMIHEDGRWRERVLFRLDENVRL